MKTMMTAVMLSGLDKKGGRTFMNVEWTVVTVIVVIVGLIISVATPLVKSTKAMAELTVNLKVLNEHLEKMDDQNRTEHKYLLDHIDEHDKTLAEHETRITVIEHTTN